MNTDDRGGASTTIGGGGQIDYCGQTGDHADAVVMPATRRCPLDPPEELSALRTGSPLRRLRYPDGDVGWLVTSHPLARTILADRRFSARSELKRVPVSRPGADPFIGQPALPGWFLDMDPPDHTRFRRLLAGHFSARRVAALGPRIVGIVDDHLDRMRLAGPPVDLIEQFALPVPSLVICELLGVPYADRAEFQRNSTILFSLDATAADGGRAMQVLTAYLLGLIVRKRREPGHDLLTSMIATEALSDIELAGVGVLLLTAGHETVASMLGLGTYALLRHPDQMSRLRADPAAADNAVEELLRYLTIFHFGVPRTPLEDVQLGDHTIAAGETVTISLPAANRDPGRFNDPDRLDLTRDPRGHLAFGYGLHQCIGQYLARIEMRVGYTVLARRFPGLALAVPPGDLHFATDMGFYGVHHLPVTW